MTGPGIPVPLVPEKPLRWQGIPLFHVGAFPEDFSGKLFFVLGQGLGDHVNGFRIVHEIQNRFPRATCVVFADLRWEELVRRIEGIEIRWYPKAKDVLSKSGTNNPYDPAHEEVRKETKFFPGRAFLAYAHFPMPDRHARQETTLEATARTIGLSLGDMARPYLPVLSSDLEWAETYLKEHHLEKGKYAVIAPFSWPNKIWAKENFSSLIETIREKHGLRAVVVSYPEIGSFDNEGAVCAYDLRLGQIAGLLSLAGLYVGLDSGPSHMAAFFDLPMVVVFVEKKVIPFEVRPLSPHALLVVESFFDPVPAPKPETVADAVAFLLTTRDGNEIPDCPACGGSMHSVVKTKGALLRLMCLCGLAMDADFSLPKTSWKKRSRSSGISGRVDKVGLGEHLPGVPLAHSTLNLNPLLRLMAWKDLLVKEKPYRFFVFLEWIVSDRDPDIRNPFFLWWNIDALIFWMGSSGYRLFEYKIPRKEKGGIVSFTNELPESEREKSLRFFWGNTVLRTTRERYLKWYSFERWADPKILVGIVKSLTELGFPKKERFACAWVAFRASATIRSFRWVIKTIFL